MVVKSLLISGNLPENGITFCYKPQSCQKPGFPRMTSLYAAEHQSVCSAGCPRVKEKIRSGKAGKSRAEDEVWEGRKVSWWRCGMYRPVFQEHRLDTTQVRGCWHQRGGSLVLWALPSAAWGKKSSASSLEGSSVTCLLSSQRGAKCLPAP